MIKLNQKMKPLEYNDPKAKAYVKFIVIDGKEVLMPEDEYNHYLSQGKTNPVLIGDVLYMVSDEDIELCRTIENEIKKA